MTARRKRRCELGWGCRARERLGGAFWKTLHRVRVPCRLYKSCVGECMKTAVNNIAQGAKAMFSAAATLLNPDHPQNARPGDGELYSKYDDTLYVMISPLLSRRAIEELNNLQVPIDPSPAQSVPVDTNLAIKPAKAPVVMWTSIVDAKWDPKYESVRVRHTHQNIAWLLMQLYDRLMDARFFTPSGLRDEAEPYFGKHEQDPWHVIASALAISRAWIDESFLITTGMTDNNLSEEVKLRVAVALSIAYKFHSPCEMGRKQVLRTYFWPNNCKGLVSPKFRSRSVSMSLSLMARCACCTFFDKPNWPSPSDVELQQQMIDLEAEYLCAWHLSAWNDCEENVQCVCERLISNLHSHWCKRESVDSAYRRAMCVRAIVPFFVIASALSPVDEGFTMEILTSAYDKETVAKGLLHLCTSLYYYVSKNEPPPEMPPEFLGVEVIKSAARICESGAAHKPCTGRHIDGWGARRGVYSSKGVIQVPIYKNETMEIDTPYAPHSSQSCPKSRSYEFSCTDFTTWPVGRAVSVESLNATTAVLKRTANWPAPPSLPPPSPPPPLLSPSSSPEPLV